MKNAWAYITGVVGTIIGFLWFFLSRRNKEIDSLKTKIRLLDTEREADIMETEIKTIRDDKARTSKEIKELENTLSELEVKRKEIKKEVKSMNNNQIEDYWNK